MLPDPIYDAYEAPIALWGSHPAPVHATLSDGRFTFGSRQLENAWVTGTDVILLNTPWNPVGTVLYREELVDIMGFAEKHDYLVISDEIYESLIYDGRRHVSPASVSADARERTILINSLSKTYAMTGWRVGYCAGPEAIIRAMLLDLAAVEPRAGHVRARRRGLCADFGSGMHATDGGGVSRPARSGRRTACAAFRESSRSYPREDCS